MLLSAKSFSVKYYRFLYGIKYKEDLPKNFCPFFWKLIIGIILGVPYLTIIIPVIIIHLFDKKWYSDKFFDKIGISLFIYILLFALTFVLCGLYFPFCYKTIDCNDKSNIFFDGFIFDVFLLALGLYFLLRHLIETFIFRDSKSIKTPLKEKKPNIFIEGIKSWYNKNCPIIEYKDL